MADATLALNFGVASERTVLNVVRQEPPWRALRAFRNASGEALVHLHNVSGGILGGDELRLEAVLQPGAQAQLAAVGATRVYRRRVGGAASSQATRFDVGERALLEYLPDAVIPFAGSSFEQKSEIYLHAGAGLIWWETLSAGRIASEERFAFDRISVDTSIYAEGLPIAIERYSLQPKIHNSCSPGRFGKYLYSSSMYVCLVGKPYEEWLQLEEELNFLVSAISTDEAKWGVSALASDGLVVRGMAQNAGAIREGLHFLWQSAKQRVFGRPALPPRRVY